METKKDYSYGVVPVIQDEGEWKVFLIYQYSSKDDVYWTFPKGHPEAGETPEESAQRELHEETGIALEYLEADKPYTQSYTFQFKETMIEKSVTYYVGFAKSKDFVLQEDEVKEAGWFSIEDAKKKLTYDNTKHMLDVLVQRLETL